LSFTNWANKYDWPYSKRGYRAIFTEFGASNGLLPLGDPRWDTAVINTLEYGFEQGFFFFGFSAGTGWNPSYYYLLEPDKPSGLQAVSMAMFQKFTGTPAQMLAAVTMAGRSAPGVASELCEIRARGFRPNSHTFTIEWFKYNPDTAAFDLPAPEVTTTPAKPVIQAGTNPAPATFTWTAPEGVYECRISSPGMAISSTYVGGQKLSGGTDTAQSVAGAPERFRVATQADVLTLSPARPQNAQGGAVLYNLLYTGPAYTLATPTGETRAFYPTDYDTDKKVFRINLQEIATWYGSDADSGIPIAIRHDQSGRGQDSIYSNNSGRLFLNGGDGYPVERNPGDGSARPFVRTFYADGNVNGITNEVIILDLSYESGQWIWPSTSNIYGSIGVVSDSYSIRARDLPPPDNDPKNKGGDLFLPISFLTDGFHQYAFTFNATQGLRGYLDGVEKQRNAVASGPMKWDFNGAEPQHFRFGSGDMKGKTRGYLRYIEPITPSQIAAISDAIKAPYASPWPAYIVPAEEADPMDAPYPAIAFTPKGNFRGVNNVAAENDGGNTDPNSTSYNYGDEPEWVYYGGKGFGANRFPVPNLRFQPISLRKLVDVQLDRLYQRAQYAAAQGQYFIIDLHNYGVIWDSKAKKNIPIATSARGQLLFNDFVCRIASRFKNCPNVVIEIQNEPNGTNAPGTNSDNWAVACINAYDAIRAIGFNGYILLTTAPSYSHADNYDQTAGTRFDPFIQREKAKGALFGFAAHQYFDQGGAGLYDSVADGAGRGQFVAATNWARSRGVELWLTEFGVARTAAHLAILQDVLAYFNENKDVWKAWLYWVGGSRAFYNKNSYIYYAGPDWSGWTTYSAESPQMPYLVAGIN
jgi:hypothetical protein